MISMFCLLILTDNQKKENIVLKYSTPKNIYITLSSLIFTRKAEAEHEM
jgi:hypothetical protein